MALHDENTDPEKARALNFLKEKFKDVGYLRHQNPSKFRVKGPDVYKKGWEVRFVARSDEELQAIRHAIFTLGYTVSKTYRRQGRDVQPLYGKEIVGEFYALHAAKKKERRNKSQLSNEARKAREALREERRAARKAKKEAIEAERLRKKAAREAKRAEKAARSKPRKSKVESSSPAPGDPPAASPESTETGSGQSKTERPERKTGELTPLQIERLAQKKAREEARIAKREAREALRAEKRAAREARKAAGAEMLRAKENEKNKTETKGGLKE